MWGALLWFLLWWRLNWPVKAVKKENCFRKLISDYINNLKLFHSDWTNLRDQLTWPTFGMSSHLDTDKYHLGPEGYPMFLWANQHQGFYICERVRRAFRQQYVICVIKIMAFWMQNYKLKPSTVDDILCILSFLYHDISPQRLCYHQFNCVLCGFCWDKNLKKSGKKIR